MTTDPSRLLGQGETERFKTLVDTISDYAIFMLDGQGCIRSWNKGAALLSGMSAEEAIGLALATIFQPHGSQLDFRWGLQAATSKSGLWDINGSLKRKDGKEVVVRFVAENMEAADEPDALYAVTMRALDRQMASRRQAEGHRSGFLDLAINITDYAIAMLSVDGHVTSWNAGAKRVSGYEADEIIGRHFSIFFTPEAREAGLPEEALKTAAEHGSYLADLQRVRKDGTRFWASVSINAIHDDSGKILGYAKILRDITDRLVQQKSVELAREEFFQRQKLEAIGQLSGGVAHDFNNLLMVVMGSLEVLTRRMPPDERNSRLIDNAYQAAQRGAQLTKRMLAFARQQDLQDQVIDLAEVIGGMGDLLSRTLGHSVIVETEFPPELPHVISDPNHLDAALLNLAVNARDAMPDGGRLRFAAKDHRIENGHPKLAPGHYVCLTVADTGEGMDEVTLSRALDPFFTTKGVGKGTGLGLPMVQGIAEQSGGMLALSSVVGQGTKVELWLKAADGVVVEQPISPSLGKVKSHGPNAKLKVLAVDDDVLVLLNTALMLEELGHEVVEAHSGAEALSLLGENSDIDLVITDHAMPRMTGVALAEAIREEYPYMPIALASGYADIEQARHLNLPRLAKPFSQSELQKLIATMTTANVA